MWIYLTLHEHADELLNMRAHPHRLVNIREKNGVITIIRYITLCLLAENQIININIARVINRELYICTHYPDTAMMHKHERKHRCSWCTNADTITGVQTAEMQVHIHTWHILCSAVILGKYTSNSVYIKVEQQFIAIAGV